MSGKALTLNYFNDDISMALATVEAEMALDMSGVLAKIELPLATAKGMFRFYTDATQDLSSGNQSDIKYYVISTNKADFKNPCSDTKMCLSTNEIPGVGAGPSISVYVNDSAGRTYANQGQDAVKHDFLRHVSKNLFNTEFGVDLFSNESSLLSDLNTKGAAILSNIMTKIESVDTTNATGGTDICGNNYMNGDANSDTSANLTMELMSQMFEDTTAKQRFQDLSANCPIAADLTRPLPFIVGDSISYQLKIKAASGQAAVVGGSNAVPDRLYRIVIKIVADL